MSTPEVVRGYEVPVVESVTQVPPDLADAALLEVLRLGSEELMRFSVDAQNALIPEDPRAVLLRRFGEADPDTVNDPRRICYGLGVVLAAAMVSKHAEVLGRPPLVVPLEASDVGVMEPAHEAVRRFFRLGTPDGANPVASVVALGSEPRDWLNFELNAPLEDVELRRTAYRVGIECFRNIPGAHQNSEDYFVAAGWQDYMNLTRILERIDAAEAAVPLSFVRRSLQRLRHP